MTSPLDLGRHDSWDGVRAVVAGFGVSGFAAADNLTHLGAAVTALDESTVGHQKTEKAELLEVLGAKVRLGPDGVLVVRMAMTDPGTGTYTILTQIAGEMLGLPPERVRVEMGDTDFPFASGSGGSFGAAYTMGGTSTSVTQTVENYALEIRYQLEKNGPVSTVTVPGGSDRRVVEELCATIRRLEA